MVTDSNGEILLSYSQQDAGVAEVVLRALTDAGFSVFRVSDLPAGQPFPAALRGAVVASQAVVVVLTPRSVHSANVGLEIGAAMAWAKPIYALLDRVPVEGLPLAIATRTFRIDELDNLVRALSQRSSALSGQERQALKDAYLNIAVPIDRLLSDTDALDRLTAAFNKQANTKLPGERLAQELLRLRKSGEIPRLRRVDSAVLT